MVVHREIFDLPSLPSRIYITFHVPAFIAREYDKRPARGVVNGSGAITPSEIIASIERSC